VPAIATVGMAFLFFLAGLEIELEAIRGKPLRLALVGWIACLPALSFAIAYAGRSLGLFDAWIVVAIALATTALGVLVPMLRDSGTLETSFGRLVVAAGVVARSARSCSCPCCSPAGRCRRTVRRVVSDAGVSGAWPRGGGRTSAARTMTACSET